MSDKVLEGSSGERLLELARGRVQEEARAILAVAESLGSTFLASVALVRSASGKVLVVGVGTSGPVARRMAHLLSTTGTPSLFLHPGDALHGSLGAVAAGDVVIAISKGGKSIEINDFARLAQQRGAKLVCLTSAGSSELAAMADVAVVLAQTPDADPAGIIAMGSSLAVAAWGDALALVLMEVSGYSWDDVLEAHPSGAVGRLPAAGVPTGHPSDEMGRLVEGERARA